MNDTTLGLLRTKNGLVVAFKRLIDGKTLFILEDATFGFLSRWTFESEEDLLAEFKQF